MTWCREGVICFRSVYYRNSVEMFFSGSEVVRKLVFGLRPSLRMLGKIWDQLLESVRVLENANREDKHDLMVI